ncbi:MAG: GatB/YqeY domain-containing protein [Verrucomicrobia bacterium]|nr:GatB/YqeY domain-containing protein [Verrucomicrobiota bacterium]
MTIQERVDHDLKDAMRAKDAERLSLLRMAKAALTNAAIEKHGAGGKLADADAVAVFRKQVKQRQDSIASYEQGGRPELARKEQKEIAYLSEYLPQPLTQAEIEQLVQAVVAETGASSKAQMGQVMKLATERAAGRVEGRVLSQVVQKHLSALV